jgi:hypothetical protein
MEHGDRRRTANDTVDRRICAVALRCSCLAVVAVNIPEPSVIRAVGVLLFCCWVPGTALFAALRAWRLVRSPAASVATSLSIVTLLGQAALATHLWAPAVATEGLAVVCGLLLLPSIAGRRAGKSG